MQSSPSPPLRAGEENARIFSSRYDGGCWCRPPAKFSERKPSTPESVSATIEYRKRNKTKMAKQASIKPQDIEKYANLNLHELEEVIEKTLEQRSPLRKSRSSRRSSSPQQPPARHQIESHGVRTVQRSSSPLFRLHFRIFKTRRPFRPLLFHDHRRPHSLALFCQSRHRPLLSFRRRDDFFSLARRPERAPRRDQYLP